MNSKHSTVSVALLLCAVAFGCDKVKAGEGDDSDEAPKKSKAAELLKERKESDFITKECRSAFKGCRFDRVGKSKKLDDGEPYVSFWYTAPIEIFDGSKGKLEKVSFAVSVTEYKSESVAKSEADGALRVAVGRYLVTGGCVGKECNRVNKRDEMDGNLKSWISGVAKRL